MSDPEIKGDVFARKGEVVTCENGHAICDVGVDLHRFGYMRAADFTNWRKLPPPQSGEQVTSCPECGAPFITQMRRGQTQIHFANGWRPHIGSEPQTLGTLYENNQR